MKGVFNIADVKTINGRHLVDTYSRESLLNKIDKNKINDNGEGSDELWSAKKISSQIKDIAKDLLLEDGKLYLKKSDGTKLGAGVVLPVSGSGGSGTGLTTEQVQQLQQAHTHSTSSHAPSNAQKNSDITKGEIEAKLTGDIATHTHSEYTGGKKQRFITQQEYNSLSSTGQLDNNTVYNIIDAPIGIIVKKVTQQQYDTESHDANTLYVIVG